jgi:hypothetical protein
MPLKSTRSIGREDERYVNIQLEKRHHIDQMIVDHIKQGENPYCAHLLFEVQCIPFFRWNSFHSGSDSYIIGYLSLSQCNLCSHPDLQSINMHVV